MNTVSYSLDIDMPRKQAWTKLQDLSLPHNYVPGVTRTEITTSQQQGQGTSRLVFLMGLLPMRETVTEWREGEGFTIELGTRNGPIPAPMKAGFFNYQLSDNGEKTTITNSMIYAFSWKWLDNTVGGNQQADYQGHPVAYHPQYESLLQQRLISQRRSACR